MSSDAMLTKIASVPKRLILSVKLAPYWAQRFNGVVETKVRTNDRDKEIRLKHEQEAKALGRDAYRGEGRKQPDSGTPVFGWNGRRNVRLERFLQDMVSMGFKLTSLFLQERQNKEAAVFLRFGFEPISSDAIELVPSGEAKDMVSWVMRQTWRDCHVYRNPDGSVTVNVKEELSGRQQNELNLRVHSDGRIETNQVARTAAI